MAYLLENKELTDCSCGSCSHKSKVDCLEDNCRCCNIEDEFILLAQRNDLA